MHWSHCILAIVPCELTIDSKITFEKHLRSVSRAASQRLGILSKSWQVFNDDCFLGETFGILSCLLWSTVLQCGTQLVIHTVNYFISIRCILMHPLLVLYQSCMCQCMLHAMLWSHIGILVRLLAAEPCSTTGLLFPCQYLCQTILITLYWMV